LQLTKQMKVETN